MSTARKKQIVNLAIVGPAGSGKTQLANILTRRPFQRDYAQTIGFEVVGEGFNDSDGTHYLVSDMAGAGRFKKIVRNELKNRITDKKDIILLCFDGTHSYEKQISEDIEEIYQGILKDTPARIYCVITKADLEKKFDLTITDKVKEFARGKNIPNADNRVFVCSAKATDDKQNIESGNNSLLVRIQADTKALLSTPVISQSSIDKEIKSAKVKAFKKIYNALREGQDRNYLVKTLFLSNFAAKLPADDEKAFEKIRERAQAEPNSRTAKAWKILNNKINRMQPKLSNSVQVDSKSDKKLDVDLERLDNDTLLIREVYQWSFAHSGFFSWSRNTGKTFLSSSSLNNAIDNPDEDVDVKIKRDFKGSPGSRTGKIIAALKDDDEPSSPKP